MSNRLFATLSLAVVVLAVAGLALWGQFTRGPAAANDPAFNSAPAGAPERRPLPFPVWMREMKAHLDRASAALDAAAKSNDAGDKAAAASKISEAKMNLAAAQELLRHVPPRPGGPVPPPSQTPPP